MAYLDHAATTPRSASLNRTRVIASAAEHHAVLDSVDWLGAHEGATVDLLPVDTDGRVDPDRLGDLLTRYRDEIAVVRAR